MHKKIMIQGTGSDVGKSLITGGLCRIFNKDGHTVSPFKSQNMALNSYVDEDGMEMGRAQVVQAEMAGIDPKVYMQPVLLKPVADNMSQLILEGKAVESVDARKYYKKKTVLKEVALRNYKIIEEKYDICVLEGAGSCAEINLREYDIVNMGMAEMIDSPVILVADVEKGGVFAQIYGSIMLLNQEDRDRIKGVIINKFRGDVTLLEPGVKMIEDILEKEGVDIPILGVVPYTKLNIEEEDSLSNRFKMTAPKNDINISIIKLPHMSNHTDFDAFEYYDDVAINYISDVKKLGNEDIIIIPGSKHTLGDLKYLNENGFSKKIKELSEKGIVVFGICGGLQILGKKVEDMNLYESHLSSEVGIGALDIKTTMGKEKKTIQVTKKIYNSKENIYLKGMDGIEISGYEIHQGVTTVNEEEFIEGIESIGVYRENIIATYIHGIFDNGIFTRTFLNNIRIEKGLPVIEKIIDYKKEKNSEFDRWENLLRENLDIKKIYEILND
ncbi:MAG: cobyric acid synthase [Psychrilyobacter sp.]|nr:cobyric acid synthase [Psychrilyobacter sp.]